MVEDKRYWDQILIEQLGVGKWGVKIYEILIGWNPEIADRFGWSRKIKSMHKELCLFKWVGSFIICWNPLRDVNESNFVPSVVLMLSDNQEEDLTLKSPVTKVKYGFCWLIFRSFITKSSKLVRFIISLTEWTINYWYKHFLSQFWKPRIFKIPYISSPNGNSFYKSPSFYITWMVRSN